MSSPPNLTTGCGSAPVTIGALCSGNGDCVFSEVYQRGVCQCYAGWRGNSDYQVTSSLVDCHINETAITVLWSIVLAIMVLATLLTIQNLRKLLVFHEAQNQRLVALGKTPQGILSNKSVAALVPIIVIGMPCVYVIAIMRIVDQSNHVIGKDWAISVIWFLCRASFYIGAMRFQPALIGSLLKGQRAVEELVWRNALVADVVLILAIISMLTMLAPLLANPSDPFDFFWGRFGFLANCVAIVCIMSLAIYQASFARTKINEVLIASYETTKDERTLLISTQLGNLQKNLRKQQQVQFGVHLFIVVAPFMWNKHDYVIILTATSIGTVGYQALRTITTIQSSAVLRTETTITQSKDDLGSNSRRDKEIIPAGHEQGSDAGYS